MCLFVLQFKSQHCWVWVGVDHKCVLIASSNILLLLRDCSQFITGLINAYCLKFLLCCIIFSSLLYILFELFTRAAAESCCTKVYMKSEVYSLCSSSHRCLACYDLLLFYFLLLYPTSFGFVLFSLHFARRGEFLSSRGYY